MKTAVICISETYAARGHALMDVYKSLGDETVLLRPDFLHRSKSKDTSPKEGEVLIEHRPYQKNLSFDRLYGHLEFSRRVRKYLEAHPADRIHCLIPANSLAKELAAYKKEHPQVQLIFDINDLWPESIPIPHASHLPGFGSWRKMRDKHLSEADLVFCECSWFEEKLQSVLPKNHEVLYWTGAPAARKPEPNLDFDVLSLCYLGSINNIIHISWIADLCKAVSKTKPVILHVIGSGEQQEALKEAILPYAKVIWHGEMYDENEKQNIFDSCHYGLNVMKPDVKVGLSMKSIDYLKAGLPLINTLQGDTKDWIDQTKAGWNASGMDLQEFAQKLLAQSKEEHFAMRQAALNLYEEKLSCQVFEHTLKQALKTLSGIEEPDVH